MVGTAPSSAPPPHASGSVRSICIKASSIIHPQLLSFLPLFRHLPTVILLIWPQRTCKLQISDCRHSVPNFITTHDRLWWENVDLETPTAAGSTILKTFPGSYLFLFNQDQNEGWVYRWVWTSKGTKIRGAKKDYFLIESKAFKLALKYLQPKRLIICCQITLILNNTVYC